MLAVERHTNAYASIVFYRLDLFVVIVFFVLVPLVGFTLDNEASTASWDKTLENCRKFFGYLLESSLNGLVLPLVKVADELFDRLPGGVQVFPTLDEVLPLFGEVGVLFKSFFVNVFIFLQSLIDFFESRDNLCSVGT